MLDCQFRIHFLDCLKDGRKKAPLSEKFFRRRKSWIRKKFVCCVHGAIVWFGAVRFEDADERAAERIIFPSYLNVAANVLNETTFSILNTSNPSNATARDLSRVLLIIVDEIHVVTIDAAKGMQEAFVRVDFGGGEGHDRIIFDGCSTVFIGDVNQPHSVAKSGIMCPVEQFRRYMSEKQMS